jgi:hypothetical protein
MRLVFAEFDRAMIVEPRQCRLHSYKTSFKFSSHVRFGLPAQPVDATLALNLCWGFEFRGLGCSLSWRPTLFS